MSTSRVAYLDGWRAASVMLVILGHALALDEVGASAATRRIFEIYAVIGVDIFFAISGFVITRGLLAERRTTGDISITSFYVRRCCRILPPLFLYLATIGFLAAAQVVFVRPGELASAALFICNTSLADCGWYTGHTWSLAYEEQFYAAFPAILALALLRRIRLLPITLIGLSFSSLAVLFPYSGLTNTLQTYLALLAGISAALTRVSVQPRPLLFVMAIAALLLAPMLYPRFRAIGALVIPAAIYLALFRSGSLQRQMSAPFVTYIGRISYSIYLWQQLALSNAIPMAWWERGLAVIGVVLLAAASFHTIEAAFISLGRRLSEMNKTSRRLRAIERGA